MADLKRVALVTGGTRGIGRAITQRLAEDGITVAAAFVRDSSASKQTQRELGGSVTLHQADLGEPQACSDLVAEVLQRHGRLDYLVNNAGMVQEQRALQVTVDDWNRHISVNLSAAFFLTQAVLPTMTASSFGRIVNVGSVTASMGSGVQIAYSAAKAGLMGLTRSTARAVARKGVTVNCVVPGSFDTELAKGLTYTDPEKVTPLIPIGRWGRPEELAHAVAFLLDERASYITGSVVTVDGGMSMGA